MEKNYTWQHWNDPQLLNTATIRLHNDHLTATGTQTCDRYSASWSLTTTPRWVTQHVSVEVTAASWARSLELQRSTEGIWAHDTSKTGRQPTDWPEPGIAPGTDLSAALDCDLGLCPVTNTMPILRLGLMEGHVSRTRLIMAWIDIPPLRVIASDQYYASADSTSVSYASGTRQVNVNLGVDSDGIVTDYPQLARRLED